VIVSSLRERRAQARSLYGAVRALAESVPLETLYALRDIDAEEKVINKRLSGNAEHDDDDGDDDDDDDDDDVDEDADNNDKKSKSKKSKKRSSRKDKTAAGVTTTATTTTTWTPMSLCEALARKRRFRSSVCVSCMHMGDRVDDVARGGRLDVRRAALQFLKVLELC
jgi:hypothetical protein